MSDTPLTAEQIAYKATVHDCGWAEHHINLLVAAREQAARLEAHQALKKFGHHLNRCKGFPATSEEQLERDCDCGFVAVLRAGEPKAQGQEGAE